MTVRQKIAQRERRSREQKVGKLRLKTGPEPYSTKKKGIWFD